MYAAMLLLCLLLRLLLLLLLLLLVVVMLRLSLVLMMLLLLLMVMLMVVVAVGGCGCGCGGSGSGTIGGRVQRRQVGMRHAQRLAILVEGSIVRVRVGRCGRQRRYEAELTRHAGFNHRIDD